MPSTAELLRARVQSFLRSFGALDATRTPCGLPLALSQAHALMILLQSRAAGAAPRLTELGSALGIDKSNATRLCQRMTEANQIRVTPCPEDGRARRVTLTARGASLARRVSASSQDRFASIAAGIPRGKRRQVLEALDLLNEALCNLDTSRP